MTIGDIAVLPVAERLQLMESLWESFSRTDETGQVVPDWHGKVLADRASNLDAGQEPVSDWADARQRLQQHTR
jgi:hypothetical protein